MGGEFFWEEDQQSRGECGEAEGFSGVADTVLAALYLWATLCLVSWSLSSAGSGACAARSVPAPEVGTATIRRAVSEEP